VEGACYGLHVVTSKNGKHVSELVSAAYALEDQLTTLEALSRTVRKHRLDSEKNIVRAAKDLNEVLKLPEALSAGLVALGTAMQQMQQRQQVALEPLAAYAKELQQRRDRLQTHMVAYAALGQAAADIATLLQAGADQSATLTDAQARLDTIAEGARALCEAGRADDFPDVVRDADALKQRASALRRRLDVVLTQLANAKAHGAN
jgi:chromosome segregation ATPase